MKRILYVLLAAALFLIAQANIALASGLNGYQPEVPEILKK